MIDTKALRQKVLDLAIRGKLVPQDPNDEPASVLLERIRAQKQQMVKDGKLKAKDIKNDTVIFVGEDNLHYEKFADGSVKCIEDEIPFDLPDGWAWCRLVNIGSWGAGATPSRTNPDYYKGNIPWLKTGDLNDGYITETSEFISELALKETSVKMNPQGSVLIAMYGATIGKLGMLTFPATTNQACCACLPLNGIENLYLFYYLLSQRDEFVYRGVGGAQPNISKEKIIATLFPVPPTNEQQQITQKIKEVFHIIETIDQGNTSIIETVSVAKSKILDLAIRGQLVPQEPADEPASVLLTRIRAEKETLIKAGKIKRDKKESVIFKGEDNSYYEKIGDAVTCIDEEIPFDIPENWCWCRLGNIFVHNTGKALNSSNTAGKALTYITTSNVYWNRFELDHLKTMPFSDDEIEKCTVQKGDLLVCEGGDIGRSAIWPFDEEIRIQNHIHRVRAYGSIVVKLYYYIFFYYKQIGKINGNGIGLQGLSSNQLHSILLPLAPFAEQQRITETIDELFGVLENIEAGLN